MVVRELDEIAGKIEVGKRKTKQELNSDWDDEVQ